MFCGFRIFATEIAMNHECMFLLSTLVLPTCQEFSLRGSQGRLVSDCWWFHWKVEMEATPSCIFVIYIGRYLVLEFKEMLGHRGMPTIIPVYVRKNIFQNANKKVHLWTKKQKFTIIESFPKNMTPCVDFCPKTCPKIPWQSAEEMPTFATNLA